MITPRRTRLVRVPDLRIFRDTLAALACDGPPLAARDRLVVVPTRAAAAHLLRTIERRLDPVQASAILPDLITPGELPARLAGRLAPQAVQVLTDAEREVLLGVSCRAAQDGGAAPPFRLRPGLVAEILRLYDALLRNERDVAAFERLALGILEPGAAYDRGAERLVRQTRFLAATFRHFEAQCAVHGADEHGTRARLLSEPAAQPYRHIVVTVRDRSVDAHGLYPADWKLLARIPGLERLDVVVTDTMLAGELHQRIHQVLPGIDELHVGRGDNPEPAAPLLIVPATAGTVHTARDREEEVAGFARRVKAAARVEDAPALDRIALVVHQPLPYVYITREVLRGAGVPCQMFDSLPLAAEPYAAAVDLVLSVVAANVARGPAIALLRSPHFRWRVRAIGAGDDAESDLSALDVDALDRALAEHGYLGDLDALDQLAQVWRARTPPPARLARALRASELLISIARELAPLRLEAPVAEHLRQLRAFLVRHANPSSPDEPTRARQLRARAAILGTLATLQDAYARFDPRPVDMEHVSGLIRRWIEGQTFAPRTGEGGVHLVDAASAPYGDFESVQLAGLVDGEWPDRPRRSIFYSPAVLRELGWSAESERLQGSRAAFADLIRLPSRRLIASTFMLEADTIVAPSAFVELLDAASLDSVEESSAPARIFEHEALAVSPPRVEHLQGGIRAWAEQRLAARAAERRPAGTTTPVAPAALSLSALERYQDCPFKFFAAHVLELEEAPEDESALSPRARGKFVHDVFHRFFEAWDARGQGAITTARVDDARRLFEETAAPLLAQLPSADAGLERTRLFGSAISVGIVDVVLGLEAARPAQVRERWLEYRLEGDFALGDSGGSRVALKGVADRIDLLEGNRLRVIDYKSGSAPNPKRALQVPIYALCAQERLTERTGEAWEIDEAAYLAFSGKRTVVSVVKPGAADRGDVLHDARNRLADVFDGIGTGAFPPRPHDPVICRYCAYAPVCRKDYVGDE